MPALAVDVAAHLDAHRAIVMFCHDDHGGPVGYPMNLFGREDDVLLFSTYRRSAKVTHLLRDPRVRLLALHHPQPDVVQWLSISGRAALWAPTPDEVDVLFGGGRRDPRVPDTMGPLTRQRTLEGKRVMLRIHLDAPGDARLREDRR